MDYIKDIQVKDYFEIHNYYSEKYGINNTIILMQVGSFHEIYSTDNEGLDLIKLASNLNITCTMKNTKLPLSKSNPRMIGFPIHVTNNFIDKLIDLNYTVVLINQVTEPPNITRKVIGIYSPATYIDKNITCFLVSMVIDDIKNNVCIGLSAYDLSTGEGSVYETYIVSSNKCLGLDDTIQFFNTYPPKELLLKNNINNEKLIQLINMDINELINYLLGTKNNTPHIYKPKIVEHENINWQRLLLNKIYINKSNIDIIISLGLEFINWGRLSLIFLLDYVEAHQHTLLHNLKEPKIFTNENKLYLGNRGLEQLNILPDKSNNKSVFDVINYTKTNLGKSYLLNQLKSPIINTEKLELRYNLIQYLINNNHYTNINIYLENIYDLDKLIHKIDMNIINPCELYKIYLSCYQFNKLINYFKENKMNKLFNIKKSLVISLTNLLQWITNTFILDKINYINFKSFNEAESTFYNTNIEIPDEENMLYNKILSCQSNIDIYNNFMKYLISELEKLLIDIKTSNWLTIKYNDRDGHYLIITTKRYKLLKERLDKVKTIQIGEIILDTKELIFTELPRTTNTKITCNKIKDISNKLIENKQLMAKLLKELFIKQMITFRNIYNTTLIKCTNLIGYIDFINSGAMCAINNHYSKPEIEEREYSFIISKELRHPIVEKIKVNVSYIPHDIELGCNTPQDGILLYGINSSGKSTLMKAIAINIILAQIGYYVAATEFKYKPYSLLYTRIGNNDNIYRGQSSFMVEIMELISILKRNNNTTLVVADEIASGSEIKSGIIIICYMLEILAKSRCSFITASHIHDIATMKCIEQIDNLKIKHLKITYDNINDNLIFSRDLLDGQGDTFYGLQVAKYLMKDNDFNERTQEILNEYDNNTNNNIKKSKYNSKVYLEECKICNTTSNLETHHIVWQKDFNNKNINENKLYLQKNNESNLVVLCSSCHDKIDNGLITIKEWADTINGKQLIYTLNNNKVTMSKYSDDIINYIHDIKSIVHGEPKLARLYIKDKYNLLITIKKIKNIWDSSN